jgi:hypothetical protein
MEGAGDLERDTPRASRTPSDFVFATGNGTPLGHRNDESRALLRAAALVPPRPGAVQRAKCIARAVACEPSLAA